jgi:hypothetical protein
LTFGAWGATPCHVHTPQDFKAQLLSMSEKDPPPSEVMQMLDTLIEQEAEAPVSVVDLKVPACSFIEYHKVKGLPSNFIAIGDSVLQLNPAFG